MAKPRLPDRDEDIWQGGFVFTPPRPLVDVSGGGGLLVAAGDELFMLRPASEGWQGRPPPEDMGAMIAVAAEHKPPWRYAVASARGITIFGLPNDQMVTLRTDEGGVQVTHMAWAAFEKESALYVRWTDGSIGRMSLGNGQIDHLPTMPMDAIASDVNGALAMIAIRGAASEAHALFTRDGVRLEERDVTAVPPPEAGGRVHLAVADAAIAYAVDGWGAHVSRGIDDDFAPCEGLAAGGPLAFQGSATDSALFGVRWNKIMCAIHRVDTRGGVQRIAEIDSQGADAPRITALQWDRSRHVLWAASPEAGLMKSEEPKALGGKKPSLN